MPALNSRRDNPKAMFFLSLASIIIFAVAGVALVTLSIAGSDRTNDTQAHGLLRSGFVTTVVTHPHSRSPDSVLGVRLEEPVNGQASTTVHVRSVTLLTPGTAVQILVDPQDPGYAEFPGQPYTPTSYPILILVFLAIIGVLGFTAVRSGRRWFRKRKQPAVPTVRGV